MPTVKELMQEGLTEEEATERYIEAQSVAFDQWKNQAKEEGTYHNPLIPRDA